MSAGMLLAIATALLVAGRLTVSALFTLAGTIALLVYTRRCATWRGTALVIPVIAGSAIAGFYGAAIVFGGWPRFVVAMTVAGIVGWAMFVVDRAIVHRVSGLAGTLAFPAVRVPVEFALSLAGPFGAWGSLAALFGAWPGIDALASVGGVPLVSAWLSWIASLTASALTSPLQSPSHSTSQSTSRRRAALAASLVLVATGAGLIRHRMHEASPTVRVAMITLPEAPFRGIAQLRDGVVAADRATLAAAIARANDSLFALSARAADSGAKIIAWSEENAAVMAADESALLLRGQAFARARGVYLAIAYAAVDPSRSRPVDNRLALLTPEGTLGWSYRKRHPVADETSTMLIGDGTIPVLATPYGRIAGVICYDTDFPRDVRRALGDRADVLLAPSNDWAGIADVRAVNTRYRAMELGVTLVRPTSHGVSEAVDARGGVIAERSYGRGDAVLLAEIPVRGVATWYRHAGDVTPAAMLALLLSLTALAVRSRSRHSSGFSSDRSPVATR